MPVVDDVRQFWNRLRASQILDEAELASIQYAFESLEIQADAAAENPARWLIERKTISPFQADVLLADDFTALRFGNYTLTDRLSSDQDLGKFLARHRLTGHAVLLDFIGGNDATALGSWRKAKDAAEKLSSAIHANLIPVHEAVSLPEYRFIVSSTPQGQRLSERIPEKARLEPAKAAVIVAQVAAALNHLHDNGLAHGHVSADVVWIAKSNHVQLQIPFERILMGDGLQIRPTLNQALGAGDVRAIAALWYRLLTGRVPYDEQDRFALRVDFRERLEKFAVPDAVALMIQSALSPSDSKGPALAEIVERCRQDALISAADWPVAAPRPSAAAYLAWLARTPGILPTDADHEVTGLDLNITTRRVSEGLQQQPDPSLTRRVGSPLQQQPDPSLTQRVVIAIGASTDAVSAANRSPSKRKSRLSVLAATLGSLLTIGILVAVVVATTRNQPNEIVVKPNDHELIDTADPEIQSTAETLDGPDNPVATIPEDTMPNNAAAVSLNQILIDDDDGELLWETPTTGANIDFAFVPSAPKIAFAFRPAELLELDEGQLLLQSLGPDLNGMIANWQRRIGVSLTDIEHLLLTLHSGEDFSFEPFAIVRLVDFMPVADLIAAWGTPTLTPAADGASWYAADDGLCFYFADAVPGSDRVQEFAVGTQALIQESIELAGASSLAGSMKTLAGWSDVDRQATMLFLRAELFNEAGQELMHGPLRGLNRQLQLAIDNNIRGGLLSLHLDRGSYLELRLDQTADMKSKVLESHVRDLLNQLGDKTIAHVNSIDAESYWDAVRGRIGAMMADFRQSWRIGAEDKHVIANAWLPPSAAHNLLAATELVLSFGDRQTMDATSTRIVPATLEELLAMPRDLSVKTSPDLNYLIKNLEQEIADEFGPLPFDFEIRIRGSDLSKEGITQNQRPGDFDLVQQPLSEILTQIMVRANPNKNITGPSDIECKLVWVTAADPDSPSRKIILITTRAAAAENSWPLPTQFLSE